MRGGPAGRLITTGCRGWTAERGGWAESARLAEARRERSKLLIATAPTMAIAAAIISSIVARYISPACRDGFQALAIYRWYVLRTRTRSDSVSLVTMLHSAPRRESSSG